MATALLSLPTALLALALALRLGLPGRLPTRWALPRIGEVEPPVVLAEAWPLLLVVGAGGCCVLAFGPLVEVKPPEAWAFALSAPVFTALPAAIARGAARRWIAGVTVFLWGFLTLADAVFWRFFGGLIPLLAAGNGGQLWDIRESIADLFELRDAGVLPLLGVVVLAVLPFPTTAAPAPEPVEESPPSRRRITARLRYAVTLGLVALGSLGAFVDVGLYLNHRYSWKVFESAYSVVRVGLGSSHLREIARTARERLLDRPLTDEETAKEVAFFTGRSAARRPPASGFGELQGLNVLVVQIEALQGWVPGTTVNGAEVTPFLNQLRREAWYYPNVHDQTGASPTSDCEYLVLNSQHPLQQGSVAFRRPGNAFVTVPKLFAEAGYTTLSAHAYRRGMWNRGVLHPAYGFASSLFERELGTTPKMGWGLSDEAFFERLVEHLEGVKAAGPGPFFAFAITLTSHHPYKYVPEDRRTLDVAPLKESFAGYLHSMRYVDDAVRYLFDDLAKRGLAEDTVVVLYGDHDAKLKVNKRRAARIQKATNLSPLTVLDLRGRTFRVDQVPLWIVPPPSRRQPREVGAVGGQVDIGPTLLHALGVRASPAFLGRPLVGAAVQGRVLRHDGSVREGAWLWDAGAGRCVTADGKRHDPKRCDALRAGVDEELLHSWTLTLHDLASAVERAGR